MKTIEEQLQDSPRNAPSAAHQARMQSLFKEAAMHRPALWRRPMAARQALALAAICALLGFFFNAYLDDEIKTETIRTTVYIIGGNSDAIRRAFDISPDPYGGLSPDSVWTSVTGTAANNSY